MAVDFVLVFQSESETFDNDGANERAAEKRKIFEAGLKNQGLLLKNEEIGKLVFVKIHAPKNVLRKYAEIMKLRMPLKQNVEEKVTTREELNLITKVKKIYNNSLKRIFTIDARDKSNYKRILKTEYSRDKSYLFDEKSPEFFTPTLSILVTDFILSRQSWTTDESDMNCVGIHNLLNDKIYEAAYPLHDGSYKSEGNVRNKLFVEWAQLKNWISSQPINNMKDYLGVKYAFYFAWLGFYNHLLILASVVGVIVLLYGYLTLPNDNFSREVCNNSSDILMCPTCDRICDYWPISKNCPYAIVSHLFDNSFTILFAFFMSIWGTLFLELWKRYSATLTHSWGLTGITTQAEHPRPDYLARLTSCKRKKINVVTGRIEPVLPFWSFKLPVIMFNYWIVIFSVMLVISLVVSVILYRMSMKTAFIAIDRTNLFAKNSSIVITITGATLNLICIMILNFFYGKLAMYLTTLELPRTQSDYDRSYTIKVYLFQFVNYYASLIYITFFKGKFVGYPQDYNRIFGFRQEECNAGGCLLDLSFQLAFIMIGKQIINCAIEMSMPVGKNVLHMYSVKKNQLITHSDEEISLDEEDTFQNETDKQYLDDYNLLDCTTQSLFNEYLEMVVQFGFVTLFVTAFPLAPFFALLNNIFELRLDAQKMLKYYRRPVPYQLPDIGVWYRILDVVSKLAVITNAVIIAFSTNDIPRLIYTYTKNPHFTDSGFLNYSLSYFDTADLPNITVPEQSTYNNVSFCRYNGYRLPPWSEEKYNRTLFYWQVFVARMVFIFLFQNVVYGTKLIVQWLIPDIPQDLIDQIKKESYITTNLIINREKEILSQTDYVESENSYDANIHECSITLNDVMNKLKMINKQKTKEEIEMIGKV